MSEIIGIGATAPIGVKEQVSAQQTTTETPAAPAAPPNTQTAEPAPKDEQDTDPAPAEGGEGEKKPQTPEERAEHAAKRRREEFRAELDKGIEKAKAEMRQSFEVERMKMQDDFIRSLGMTDEFTGKPIGTQAEYNAYMAERTRRMADDKLKKAGIDRSVLDAVISTHPKLIEAEQLAQRAKTETYHARDISATQKAKAELEAIQTFDPSVKSLDEVLEKEKYPEIRQLVAAKVPISLAYRTVYAEEIEQKRVAAAIQQAINEREGKGHLRADGAGRGAGGTQMPAEDEQALRSVYPNATREELQKKYEEVNRFRKKG